MNILAHKYSTIEFMNELDKYMRIVVEDYDNQWRFSTRDLNVLAELTLSVYTRQGSNAIYTYVGI